ncbi:MAG: PorT family protein [Chitinophagales bacterium]|nr:PorT family protein [Chitinophagales bacterium]
MRLQSSFFRPFIALCLFLAPFAAQAQIEDADLIFKELYGLEGTWFLPTDRGDRLEIWKVVNDSTMEGRGVRIKPENGDTVNLETLSIEWRGNRITYYAAVRLQNGGKPIAFEMTLADENGYLFENPNHDDPQKIRYRLLGNRELQVNTEGKRGNRVVTQEYVFEREFTPGAVEFRLRAGINGASLRSTGQFQTIDGPPSFGWKPGWEIGTTALFKGRGGFISINADLGLQGRFSAVDGAFVADTAYYVRNGTYNTTWLNIAVLPEITFRRDGLFSLMAGPYFSALMFSRANGEILPEKENNDLYNVNNDLKKIDFGLALGMQYKLNFGKKDVGGILGLRGTLGLRNLDNLYDRDCNNPAYCNGQVFFNTATLYYSVNLLKL